MIASNISAIRQQLPPGVDLVAVSKWQTAENIMQAYAAGQRYFGENRAQEFAAKFTQLPKDIVWHFIGHLQTNKVKMVVGKAALIHSVDSARLLWAIEREALQQGVSQKCLLELHIAAETSKSGFSAEEWEAFIGKQEFRQLKAVKICGLMGMASLVENEQQVRAEFRTLKHQFDTLKESVFAGDADFCHLSMGMSGDWPLAVAEGSTLIRVGTQIFG